jgi:hypothetical protein
MLPNENADHQTVLLIDREILLPGGKLRINKAKTTLRYHWHP